MYHRYNENTREFINSYAPAKNRKGHAQIEANSTPVEPLAQREGFSQIFNGGKWEYVVDNRDKTYYLNGELVKFELGHEITAEMSLAQYTDEELLAQAKQAKAEAYSVDKFLDIDGVIYSTHRADILKYKDATDVSQGMGLTKVKLRTGSGDIEVTIADARAVLKTLSEQSLQDYWAEQDYIALVDNATSMTQLNQL